MKKLLFVFALTFLVSWANAQTKKELIKKTQELELQQKVLDLKYAEMVMRTEAVQKQNEKLSTQIELLTKIIIDNQRTPVADPVNGYAPSGGSNSKSQSPKPKTTQPAPKPPQRQAPAYSGQCMATTKKGSQCSRSAAAGSTYCWQHQ